jgi:hypothetical protein
MVHNKIGSIYGGWYVPIGIMDSSSVCYTVGAGEDISFDIGLVKKFNCHVFVCDPTPRAVKHYELLRESIIRGADTSVWSDKPTFYNCDEAVFSHLHYLPYGVWNESKRMRFYAPKDPAHVSHSLVNLQCTKDYFEADCRAIKDLMSELNHSHIHLLKLDVEGAEYKILHSLLSDGIFPSILCIEFDEGHTPRDREYIQRIIDSISGLKQAGYLLTHVASWNVTFVHQLAIDRVIPKVIQ